MITILTYLEFIPQTLYIKQESNIMSLVQQKVSTTFMFISTTITTMMIMVSMSTTMTEAFSSNSFLSSPSRMTDGVRNNHAIVTSLAPSSDLFSTATHYHRQRRHHPSMALSSYSSKKIFRSNDWKYTTSTIIPCSSSSSNMSNDSNNKEEVPLFEPFLTGIRRDFHRRLPLYKTDITDGLNAQTLATVLFLFFACLAPAIGFGGVLQTITFGQIGTIEMVLSTSLCGVLYALFAAQPLQLVGPMGPNLAFTVGLFRISQRLTLPFLPLYAYTGLWCSLILALCACTSASNVTKHLTAFTDEIFSVLISTIFLVGAVQEVVGAFSPATASSTTALLTLLCASITFGTSIVLKGLNRSVYFTKRIRDNLSNFAPAIGVLVGSLLARAALLRFGAASGANLASLSLPVGGAGFVSTTLGRSWLIPWKDLVDFPMWAKWVSFFPATLAALLLFLDQNITARLVNHPRYKQKKGRDLGNVTDGSEFVVVVVVAVVVVMWFLILYIFAWGCLFFSFLEECKFAFIILFTIGYIQNFGIEKFLICFSRLSFEWHPSVLSITQCSMYDFFFFFLFPMNEFS